MEGVEAIPESVRNCFGGSAERVGGASTGGSLGTCLVGTRQVVGRGFGGNGRMATVTVERVTQWTVVDIEGRRVVVGRDGTPALVGLGTSVPGFKGGRRRLAAVCCQAMVFCGSLLGCRGALTRQKTTSVG